MLLMVSVIPGHYKSEIRSEISINSWKISRSILINSLSLLILFLLIFFTFNLGYPSNFIFSLSLCLYYIYMAEEWLPLMLGKNLRASARVSARLL